jgi:hypothetical protein
MSAAFVCNALCLPTDFENHTANVGGAEGCALARCGRFRVPALKIRCRIGFEQYMQAERNPAEIAVEVTCIMPLTL